MSPSPTHHSPPYFKLLKEGSKTAQFASAALAAGPWLVPDLCAAYNWPTGLAGGGVIAIVELGGGWVQSDMDEFFQSLSRWQYAYQYPS